MHRAGARLFKWLSFSLGGLLVIYLLAALVGSLLPANPGWQQYGGKDAVTVYVGSNGVHTGLVLPVKTSGEDWTTLVRPEDLPNPGDTGKWLMFGWGDRRFYLETPTWAEVRPGVALAAFAGSGTTLVHVDHLNDPSEAGETRVVKLSPDEYRKLSAFIRSTFDSSSPREKPIPGYGNRDVFYKARGRYSFLRTCNCWTSEALAAAGVKAGRWTPFSDGVLRWFPVPAE